MKIVNIEDFFHPSAGYQINALSKALVARGHEIVILCAEIDKMPSYLTSFFGLDKIAELDREFEKEHGVTIKRLPVRKYYSGRTIYADNMLKLVRAEHPDILFVHGNDSWCGMYFTLFASKVDCPIVMDSHMVSIAAKNKFARIFRHLYRHIFAPIVNAKGIPVVRVQDDRYILDDLGIDDSIAPVIPLGTDTSLFSPNDLTREEMRGRMGIGDRLVFLYAGKLDESKGGLLLANAIKDRFHGRRDAVIVIVGTPSGEKKDDLVRLFAECENELVQVPTKKYTELPPYYQMADVVLFPAQCSLSFYDAQACGRPVLVDDSTIINIDRVSHDNGMTFSRGNSESLRALMKRYLDMDSEDIFNQSKSALQFVQKNYSWESLAEKYENLFESLVNDNR